MIKWHNQSVVLLAHNPILHAVSYSKHKEIGLFFVWEKVLEKQLTVKHIPDTDQWEEPLTKSVSTVKIFYMRSKLKVADFSSSMSLRDVLEYISNNWLIVTLQAVLLDQICL